MRLSVEVDSDTFYKAMVRDLERTLQCFEADMVADCPNIFVYGDPEADKAEIQKHIDAVKLVISWYDE